MSHRSGGRKTPFGRAATSVALAASAWATLTAPALAQRAPAATISVTHQVILPQDNSNAELLWFLSSPDFLRPFVSLRCTVRGRVILQARSTVGDDLSIGRRVLPGDATRTLRAAMAARGPADPTLPAEFVRCQASPIPQPTITRSSARLIGVETIEADLTLKRPSQVRAIVRVSRFEDQAWPANPVVMCAFMSQHRLSLVEFANVPPLEAGRRVDLSMSVQPRPGEVITGVQCGPASEEPRRR